MANYNRITIVGHVGKEPEIRYTANNEPVANFSVAYTRKRRDEENTTWFRCTAFGKTAEIVEKYVQRGGAVMVEGEMNCRKYQDKQGMERESWEVSVNNLVLLGGKASEESAPPPRQSRPAAPKPKQAALPDADLDDDIPFN
jgi:single-strand DNA-binding protein